MKRYNSLTRLTVKIFVGGLVLTVFGFISFLSPALAAEEECYHCQNISPDFLDNLSTIKFTSAKVVPLAAVDAVNPCTLAVLGLMLTAVLTYNPTKRRNILLAGLAFIFSVFIMYLLYGLIIVESFQLLETLKIVQFWLYKAVALGAVILGLLKIRAFSRAKSVCSANSKIDRFILKITSPRGAFLIGALVTVFLLPCTIGPYIICGGILCQLGLFKAIPWLLLYNLIFILPMLAVVFLIYFGLRKVEDISSWQARNIKYLHLISGLIILFLGIAMIFGLV
jgi:hypothetical protein